MNEKNYCFQRNVIKLDVSLLCLQKFVSENLVCMMMCTFFKVGTQILEESTVLVVC